MNLFKLYTTLFVCVVLISALSAQESQTRYGMGVNFAKDFVFANVGGDFSIVAVPYDFSNFSIIIRGARFRVEPSIGYFRYSGTYSEGTFNSESVFSNWRLGVNLALNRTTDDMHHYYGIGIGFIFSSIYSKYRNEFDSGEEDESKTDFFIGPVLGGEYNFSEYLSIGGEIQFNYISLGQYDEDPGEDSSESALTTRAIIVLRCYFK